MNSVDIDRFFGSHNGFGLYKDDAINLLKKIISLLDEFEINYFLISGTLLGYVRHNDIIPWDDDIDLIVDNKIFSLLDKLVERYNDTLCFIKKHDYIIKICFKNKIKQMNEKEWDNCVVGKGKYYWPFVDLFIYNTIDITRIKFFNKIWDSEKFFPPIKTKFLDIDSVSIPRSPDYFLKINYGKDYMAILQSNKYQHKNSKIVIKYVNISLDEYNTYKTKTYK